MAENPYQPPATSEVAPASGEPGITFNDYDLETVSKATSWMRRVATIQFLIGSFLLLVAVLAFLLGNRVLFGLLSSRGGSSVTVGFIVLAVYILILLLGAIWLRQSCVAFYDGIMSNREQGLAIGFRKLHLYFILYGVYGLVGLALTLIQLAR